MAFFKRLLEIFKQEGKIKSSKGWKTTKIADDLYVHEIHQETKDKWVAERRQKDRLDKFINQDGFYLKGQRTGIIYYVDKERVCEIEFEMSDASQFDILIYFDRVKEWVLPSKRLLTEMEKADIKQKLSNWLTQQNIKAEL